MRLFLGRDLELNFLFDFGHLSLWLFLLFWVVYLVLLNEEILLFFILFAEGEEDVRVEGRLLWRHF